MGKQIDVRIMKLNKWYVPKSVNLSDQTNPVILGCFDELEVHGLQVDVESKMVHPFMAGYKKQMEVKKIQKEKLADFSTQEQILFLNINDEETADGISYKESTVQSFWNYQNSTLPYLYLTMIHISHINKLCHVLGKINKVFKENYLSYISYDYCDIILFAQNLFISDYLEKIKQLFALDSGEEKSIFDTFSMVCFHPKYAYGQFHYNTIQNYLMNTKDRFQATINISVRDHKRFKQWYQQNVQEKVFPSGYYIYGRHDISIIKEDADTKWLMRIMEMLHDTNHQAIFWTFETFIKVKCQNNIDMESDGSDYLNSVYDLINQKLQTEIDELKKAIDNSNLRGEDRYILPIYEVRDCICGIVKNSFAEEFICCIYESFLHFVSYMKNEIEMLDVKSKKYYREKKEDSSKDYTNWEDKIAESYDKYFVALNALVNSTMHNERQFVQATAFNAVFYSVPPKILAFYNAYIFRVKQILTDKNCRNQYTFLIYPSFLPTIMLEQISLDEDPPCDRILTVKISEESLYDIESVMYQLVHELAHQVGNGLRCREERTQQIDDILLKWIVKHCGIGGDTYQILQQKLKDEDEGNEDFKHCKKEYLQYIYDRAIDILCKLNSYQDFQKASAEYFMDNIAVDETYYDSFLECCGIRKEDQHAYVKSYDEQYDRLKCIDFKNHLSKMDGQRNKKMYIRYIDIILQAYRECYADLQMILVLAMSAEDYLNTFLIGQKLPIKALLSQPHDLLRICTIFRAMEDCGLWKAPSGQGNEGYQLIYKFFNEYNSKVAAKTEENRISESRLKAAKCMEAAKTFDFKNGIRLKESLSTEYIVSIREAVQGAVAKPLIDLAAGLYEYLLRVIEESLKEYSALDKLNQIRQVRKLTCKMLAFEDATEIFNCVEAEIDYYKQKGCEIYSS